MGEFLKLATLRLPKAKYFIQCSDILHVLSYLVWEIFEHIFFLIFGRGILYLSDLIAGRFL